METPNKEQPTPSSTPTTPNSASSRDTYHQASECLRKLKQDIAVFRDPSVRSYLQTIPLQLVPTPSSPLSLSLQTTPTRTNDNAASDKDIVNEQHAKIIALQTSVRSMEDIVRNLEAMDLKTRKRAARAEGQLSELQTQRDAQERAHQAAIDEAAQRIRSLENEAMLSKENAENERNRLIKVAETTKNECSRLSTQLTRIETRAQLAEQRMNTTINELKITRDAHAAEVRAIHKARTDAEEREREIRSLLESTEKANRLRQETANHTSEKNEEDFQNENVKLKSEIEWLSKKNNLVQKSLAQAEEERDSLRFQIRQATEQAASADRLRDRVHQYELMEKQFDQTKQLVDALQLEKNEMKKMIVALSSNGDDVAEGVAILRALGNRKDDKEGVKKLMSQWLPDDEGDGEKQNPSTDNDSDVQMTDSDAGTKDGEKESEKVLKLKTEIEESRKKIASLESQLATTSRSDGEKVNQDGQGSEKEGVEEGEIVEGPPDFDSKVCKVFHLTENPMTQARREAEAKAREEEKLRSEKKSGRRTSDNMSTGDGIEMICDISSKEEVDQMREELKEMREEHSELKHKAKLGDRMRLVALQRIEEVKSAVYNLFGWSMRINGRLYYLSSIYAESEAEVLHFRVNDQGGIALMDCEYARHLSDELEQFVERMNSFPALLSHVTMTNFEKTTACH